MQCNAMQCNAMYMSNKYLKKYIGWHVQRQSKSKVSLSRKRARGWAAVLSNTNPTHWKQNIPKKMWRLVLFGLVGLCFFLLFYFLLCLCFAYGPCVFFLAWRVCSVCSLVLFCFFCLAKKICFICLLLFSFLFVLCVYVLFCFGH